MARAEIEAYKQHQVWEVLRLKYDALKTARYGNANVEKRRTAMAKVLNHALKSQDNPQPILYADLLDELQSLVNQIPSEESQFQNFANSHLPKITAQVRSLPGPPPRNMPQTYVDWLDEAIALRERELSALREEITDLRRKVAEQEKSIHQHGNTISKQEEAVAEAESQIQSVAKETEAVLNDKYADSLKSWMEKRDRRDEELDHQMTDQVSLLTAAALVGQRLVEHAAGNLTALDWTTRATRERRSGRALRGIAIVFGLAGLGLALYILDRAVKADFDLTVGDGLLRAAAVISVIAVGGFFAAESRRHYAESDTAEEVATAMRAIEPYYAGASETDRTTARNAVGETVFVKNVLSRFTSRDAGRHNEAVSSQDLSQIVDELTRVLRAAQEVQSASSPGQG